MKQLNDNTIEKNSWSSHWESGWRYRNSGDSKNFFQGVPRQAQITQSNKNKILYIDNNNNKKTCKYIKFIIVFYEFSYFEIVT